MHGHLVVAPKARLRASTKSISQLDSASSLRNHSSSIRITSKQQWHPSEAQRTSLRAPTSDRVRQAVQRRRRMPLRLRWLLHELKKSRQGWLP